MHADIDGGTARRADRFPAMRRFATIAALALAACQSGGESGAVDTSDPQPYSGIGADETVQFTGTEPFWGGEVSGGMLTYSTPDNQQGESIAVERFAGRNGVSWTGTLGDAPFTLAVTPGDCSDGMSDRAFPFAAMAEIGGETREGCAWTDAQPFTGPQHP